MKKNIRNFRFIILALLLFVIVGCSDGAGGNDVVEGDVADKEQSEELTEHTITDMDGREVTLPTEINKTVLLGPVPVLSTFVLAVGEGDTIVNGLPDSFANQNRWLYLPKFAPNLSEGPIMQGEGQDSNVEEILKADPDVVLVASKEEAELLADHGLPVVFLAWEKPEDVKETINLIGEIYNKEERATEYTTYFDESLEEVKEIVDSIPEEERVSVLNINLESLSLSHEISDWWITQAGGINVVSDELAIDHKKLSIEQVLAYDPDVLIVGVPEDIDEAKSSDQLQNLKAIKEDKLYSPPLGAHKWANRTSEQPLMVMWAAKHFYPEEFKDFDLIGEMKYFYDTFFDYELTDEEAENILAVE